MNSKKRGKAVVRRDVRCAGPGWALILPAGVYLATIETRYIPVSGGLRSEPVSVVVQVTDTPVMRLRTVDLAQHCRTGDVEVRPGAPLIGSQRNLELLASNAPLRRRWHGRVSDP